MDNASGTVIAMMIERPMMPSDQPKPPINPALTGAKTNCPAEPPAVTMPRRVGRSAPKTGLSRRLARTYARARGSL